MQFSPKSARVEAGLTQIQAAKALGINKNTLANYESGKTSPSIDMAQRMAMLYNMKVDDINFLRT